jgi:nitrile hydratase accessory protein
VPAPQPSAVLDIDGPAAPPRSNGELVFAEPWESRAFGLAMTLNAGGVFEWEDFRRHLIRAVAEAEQDLDGDEPFRYYRCWLLALERVLDDQGVVGAGELVDRAGGWDARPPCHDHDHDGHDHDGHDHDGHGHGHDGHGHDH